MFLLSGKMTSLVPFSKEHIENPDYFGWLTDYEVVKTINRLDYMMPVSKEAVRDYCQAVLASNSDIFFAIKLSAEDRFVGTLRVAHINWRAQTADVGILVGDRSVWGQGVATDAIRVAGTYLFQNLGLRKLTAGLMAVNEPMRRVFLGLGFHEEGRLRMQDRYEDTYCDHIYLGCFKDEFRFETEQRQ